MACDLTQGFARICKDSLGGASKLYLFNFIDTPFTITANVATAISASLITVYGYALEGDQNTLEEAIVSDSNTGTSVNTQTINIILKKISAVKGAEMNLLAYNFPQVVIKDRNGIYHCLALTDGMDFTITQSTGGAKGDLNGYTLAGVSTEGALSAKMDSATATAFELLVTP